MEEGVTDTLFRLKETVEKLSNECEITGCLFKQQLFPSDLRKQQTHETGKCREKKPFRFGRKRRRNSVLIPRSRGVTDIHPLLQTPGKLIVRSDKKNSSTTMTTAVFLCVSFTSNIISLSLFGRSHKNSPVSLPTTITGNVLITFFFLKEMKEIWFGQLRGRGLD